jgi:hypothetical protein
MLVSLDIAFAGATLRRLLMGCFALYTLLEQAVRLAAAYLCLEMISACIACM